jgi:hypothetical protein
MNLPAMRVTGKLKGHACILTDLIGKVWFVQEQDNGCSSWRMIKSWLQIRPAAPTIIHSCQVKNRFANTTARPSLHKIE